MNESFGYGMKRNAIFLTLLFLSPVFAQSSDSQRLDQFAAIANQSIQVYWLRNQLTKPLAEFWQNNASNLKQTFELDKVLGQFEKHKQDFIHWQKKNDNLFVAAKNNNQNLHFCVSTLEIDNGIHPGVVTEKKCKISYAGKTYLKNDFWILSGKQQYVWLASSILNAPGSNSPVPANFSSDIYPPPHIAYPSDYVSPYDKTMRVLPVLGGYEGDTNEPIFLCRVIYNNEEFIGKYSKNFCHISVGEKEVDIVGSQILFVTPHQTQTY